MKRSVDNLGVCMLRAFVETHVERNCCAVVEGGIMRRSYRGIKLKTLDAVGNVDVDCRIVFK